MKILHLSKYYYPYSGGIEQVVQDICEGISSKYTCSVLALSESKKYYESNLNGVQVYNCPVQFSISSASFSIKYISTLIKIIKDFDIIHIHLPNPLANIALMLAKEKNKKIIVHWHSDIVKQRYLEKIYRPFQNWLLKRTNLIIATSPAYVQGSRALFPFKEKVNIIPIGVNKRNADDELTQLIKNKYGNKKIIFSLGRHVYYKGFENLIKAGMYLSSEYIILIGGKGPLTSKYRELIDDLNCSDKVKLIGRIDERELPSYFSAADIFCLPSVERSEAFGVVQIEAFSHEKPVVSCDIRGSGVSWVNKDAVSGLVVEVNKPKAIANAINEIFSSYEKYSKCAYLRYINLFTASGMNKKIITLYENI